MFSTHTKYNLSANYPFIRFLKVWLNIKNLTTYFLTQKRIKMYLEENDNIKLNIGCGRKHLNGWLNADINYGEVYLNATKKLPFRDDSVNFIFSEFFIQVVSAEAGLNFIQECFRVLKPEGVLRLSTLDLQFLINLYLGIESEVTLDDFSTRIQDVFQTVPDRCTFINKTFTAFLQVFCYDFDYLKSIVQSTGFSKIKRPNYGESEHDELKGIEQHSNIKWYQDKATLIIEAVK